MERLPQTVRKEIDQRLIANGFGDYVAIADELYARGYKIGKSAVHRYGKEMERRVKLGRAQEELAAAGVSAELAAELTGDSTLVVVIDRRNSRARLISLPERAPDVIARLKNTKKS
jgi:leucyl aminopeptidase (aminopeptidase T)